MKITATFLAALVASAASGFVHAQSFTDDFNRPDSPSVGNGWFDALSTVGNFGTLQILNNEATFLSTNGGSAGIYRPADFSGLFADSTLKPLSQYARPVMPLGCSRASNAAPAGPPVTLCSSS